MQKLVALALTSLLLVSLSACATTGAKSTRVKCPACGYEFDTPGK